MSATTTAPPESMDAVVIRFAGDSGDGIQLTGTQFTTTSALVGNDVATFPDYPAEIRAPLGTLPGVSGFQLQFSSRDIFTPGDEPDVLVAMNAAALKVNLSRMQKGRIIIVNTDGMSSGNLSKAGYEANPLEDGTLDGFRTVPIPMTQLTTKALEDSPLDTNGKQRCKNFYALGVVYWLYSRPLETTENWIRAKFKAKQDIMQANLTALQAGYAYAQASELFQGRYEVPPAPQRPGVYRNIDGNTAIALGMYAASVRAGAPLFLGSYPITPASEILAELSKLKPYGVITFQAEDEIAGICSAIGAAFGGCIGLTTTSGPGLALKTEAIGLAVMTELPLVIVNVQRGGPSTGLPTKTEQADLLQAYCGRNGESPVAVIAARSAADCFETAIEAVRIATKYMTPVILLSDGYIANSSEPWKIRKEDELPELTVKFRTEPDGFLPFNRNPDTLARDWVRPGTPGLEHRIGGLEHTNDTGNISYDPLNHELMTRIRAEKIEGIAKDIPPAETDSGDSGDLLLIGWGGTYGSLHSAAGAARAKGIDVSHLHLRHIHPFPANLGELMGRFRRVLVAELNRGQLAFLLRARYLFEPLQYNKVQGQPFQVSELVAAIEKAQR